ncbi:A/G-specific adenine glycosylase [Aggregatimonas sangjinii]|uniref:Adenine DNA glycosylase n=1 Tax=Aggregatimonas sangjinii TaxID=2583587 RepID=A0A5B7SZE0_9FLAO|nr:A/G-specific adenine glycosylase [Aggregatimonas sangjinii]QCX02174.1 A/G-specific adenine glycosylase [Aggregatimonas sangjinii]
MPFSQKILQWYAENKRELPWRSTTDPYKIWLSEIMLQQTRVAQGTPYYLKFVKHFPTVVHLADAPEEEVLKLWQGLGYYSRARNLHATAKKVAYKMNGEFPDSYAELIKLKGIGDYTASAIASICFGELQPVVDGNVFRVLARYFGVDRPINDSGGPKYFKKLAREVMPLEEIREYNQGIMEFGAIQCAPKKPYCLHCPLNESCVALQKNKVHELPIKLRKTKVRNRFFNYLVVLGQNEQGESVSILNQRTGKGIWQNLYEFPLVESEARIGLDTLKKSIPSNLQPDLINEINLYNEKEIVHKLSHQHLHTRFWIVKTTAVISKGIPLKDLEKYAVPVLIAEFMKAFKF